MSIRMKWYGAMRRAVKSAIVGVCVLSAIIQLPGCAREYGVDADTGGKCPNGRLGYRCTISSGSYGPYHMGMSIEDTYGVICIQSYFNKLEYIAITTTLEEATDELITKYNPLRATYEMNGYPNGHAVFHPDDAVQCTQMAKDLSFVRDIAVRRSGFFGGDAVFLDFEDHKLVRLTLSKVFPLNEF